MFRLFSSLTIRPISRCLKGTRWIFPIFLLAILVLVSKFGTSILLRRSKFSKVLAGFYNNNGPREFHFSVETTTVRDESTRYDLQHKDFRIHFKLENPKSNKRLANPVIRLSGFGDDIQLFSAIAGNSTTHSSWDKLAITGWEAGYLQNRTFICCVAFSSGTIQSFSATKLSYSKMCRFVARQFVCLLGESQIKDKPVAATIADSKSSSCPMDTADYVEVEYAYKHPEEIAVFVKLLFGNISAYNLVAWIEFHKLQGANKFVVYCQDLNTDALRVLQYYEQSGILDIIPYRPFPTGFKTCDEETEQLHSDQEASLYDALQRLKGYKYVMYFDTDEYIFSRKGETWMTEFDRMFNGTPDAGAFWFQTYFFAMSWGPSGSNSPFRVVQYLLRMELMADARKFVYIPSTLNDTGIEHHQTHHVDGYKSYNASAGDFAIHHYRECRQKWLHNKKVICFNVSRVQDKTVLMVFRKVEENVLGIIDLLGIDSR